ncbi:MAG: cytochrome c3 family protein [Elusimicrobia bacterium]|nr:cytochrome c3 family protein [Elusimicrobiota bacterium]
MNTNHKYKISGFVIFISFAAIASWAALGGSSSIVGSRHDFSGRSWNSHHGVCNPCHVPHFGSNTGVGLLWNRRMNPTVFTVYSSPTMDTVLGQPDGASKLCLSCHDGTVAIDYGGYWPGSEYVAGSDNLGTDLSNDHPVSFVYDSAMAASAKTLKDPAAASSGLGGTISQDMLRDGKLQCVSCHNPHNPGNGKFLVKSNAGSALCLTCHNF